MEFRENISSTSPLLRPHSKADFDDYRATPLLITGADADDELIANQDRYASQFANIAQFELARYVDTPVIQYVGDAITSRMHQREGLNGSEYYRRLHRTPDVSVATDPEEVERACYDVLHGRGTVLQNDLARRAFGMASTEYANLTIVGEFRHELETPMWHDVSELLGTDATPHFNQMTNLQVLGFERNMQAKRPADSKNARAMRIGMKRVLGSLDDGTVLKSRTTAIINTNPAYGLDPADFKEIHDSVIRIPDGKDKPEFFPTDMAKIPAFRKVLRWLIEAEMKPGAVLARNETVYGYNKAVNDAIIARRDAESLTV